ncbi:MAG: ABC transporter permease [Brevinema sp.]
MNSRILNFIKIYGVYITFIILLLFNLIFTKNFLEPSTIWNLVIYSMPIIFVALGMNFVISMGNIDISIGSTVALGGMIFSICLINFGMMMAFIISIVSCIIVGSLIGYGISKYNIQPIIMTLAGMFFIRGLAQLVVRNKVISLPQTWFTEFLYMRIFDKIPIQLFFIIFAVSIFYIIANRTILGRYITALGDNKNTAVICGVNIILVTIIVHALVATMAGIVGIFEVVRLGGGVPGNIGLLLEFKAIASVAIGGSAYEGGKPRIIGTTFGALMMTLITQTIVMNNVHFAYSLVLETSIILLAIAVQKISPQVGIKYA